MQLHTHDRLSSITPEAWNALNSADNPFLRYEFLATLENTGCVGQKTGWIPQYITAHIADDLVAAVPMYIKHHSYGEYIFDWSWADAYQQHGLAYYPKLVLAIPFTPVSGERLLIHPTVTDKAILRNALINYSRNHAKTINSSSIHCLFTTQEENQQFMQQGFMERIGYQFHWQNNHYSSFDHFLSTLASRHRKKIKRERQRIKEQGIQLKIVPAGDINKITWQLFYHFYSSTCHDKGGVPYLNLAFFENIATALPQHVFLVTAQQDDEIVAAAFFMRNKNTLYGRYWGCAESFHSLHFEACYYTPIEYCIKNQIDSFEAGAQGEHKISRGLLPTPIYSTHWLADQRFSEAVAHFLVHEKRQIQHYHETLNKHSPFKKEPELINESLANE